MAAQSTRSRSVERRRALLPSVVLLGVAVLASACDRSGEIRSALEREQADWTRRVSALQTRVSDMEARVSALPRVPRGGSGRAQAQRQRLQGSIIGARETLIDIQSHAADGARDVESASRRSYEEAEGTLAELSARMSGYLQQQEQALAVNEDAITRAGEDVRP